MTPTETDCKDQVAMSVYHMRTKPDLAKYLHLACWSPSPRTWCDAIEKGYFATFPGLTTTLVNKYLGKSISTAKGHLKRTRKNLRSTSQPNSTDAEEQIMTASDYPDGPNARTNLVTFKTIVDFEPTGIVATDQTGRFPVRSSRGNQYLMVAYIRDANAIIAIPIKNRSESSLLAAYSSLYDQLTSAGLKPTLQICDNECPATFKKFLKLNDINLQLVPPYDHRTNPAEKAIDTFKSHFLAGLASLPPEFPLHLWDRLVEPATITLNLLRPSKLNPRLSAYAQLYGTFDYNRTPLCPPGCRALIHDSPGHRATWNAKGTDAWYIGPATNHYRCHRLYIPKTRSERISRTVDFFPHNCAVPFASPLDAATRAADSLATALKGHQANSPFGQPCDAQYEAIQQLSNIFSKMVSQKTSKAPHQTSSPRVITPSPPRVNTKASPQKFAQHQQYPNQIPPITYNVPTPKSYPPPTPNYISDDEYDSDDNDDGEILSLPDDTPDPPATPRYNLRSRYAVACAVLNEESGALEEYPALIRGKNKDVWYNAYGNDLCRLAQGMPGRPDGTDTIKFIHPNRIPKGRKVTYGKKECTIRPNKEEVYRVRLTVGGDKLPYSGITTTQCASLTTAKLLMNSTISTPGARFGCIDIKNMYYGTPMDTYEYMKIKYDEIPPDVVAHYRLNEIVHNGYVYMEIQKGMPGLKQAGKIANDRLTKHLDKYGYQPCPHTPALWKHESNGVTFALVVDDFGVKYVGERNFQHLINALNDLYTITVDPDGKSFLGLSLKWDYVRGTVDISMPGYIEKALKRFKHIAKGRKQHSPHEWRIPMYGKTTQYATDDTSPPVPASAKKHVQQVVGSLLYYALALDFTMLVALGSIASQQTKPTEKTMSEVTWLLNYCAAHPEATIRYHKSDMVLWTASDASYLSENNARSRAGAIFFLSDMPQQPGEIPTKTPPLNGAVHVLAKIINAVMSSAMEAEVGATFLAAKEAVPIRTALHEMGHEQPPTPMQVDNSTAIGFINNTIKHKRSKAIDMRFHWIKDRVKQKQFVIYWVPGKDNFADYVTKHHPATHHLNMRKQFFTEHLANVVVSQLLQGCDRGPNTHVLRTA